MAIYSIRVIGEVDADWSEWFDGLTISNIQSGEAMISGEIVDQSALHGTLNKIFDLNLALISVTELDSRPDAPNLSSRAHKPPIRRERRGQ
ncbi:MAG TPA: hypothetical protein VIQ76_11740 [Propionibacteriaceae bacterium]